MSGVDVHLWALVQNQTEMAHRYLSVMWLGILLLVASRAGSTTIVPLTFGEVVSQAETIFLGEAVSRRNDWHVGPHGRSIVTEVTFKVERVLKGPRVAHLQLTFLGGVIGDLVMRVAGMPEFRVGERDVLFVSANRSAISPIVGFSYGRFRVVRDPATRIDLVRTHDDRPFFSPIVADSPRRLMPVAPRPLAYSEFEALVMMTIAQQTR